VSRWLGNPLPGSRLRVELRPTSVGLVRRGVVPRSRVLSTRAIPVEGGAGSRENSSESWRAAVDTLTAALREPRGRVGRVEIVLSDHFVRYLLMPWSEGLVGDGERLEFARLAFRDLYGHLADTWDACLDEQPAGEASFACAVDRALASSLGELVAGAGGQLTALIPSLADCINRHRSALKATEFCLAAAEPGRVSLAFRSRGGWEAVRSRRVDGPLSETLPTLLKQEIAVGDASEGGTLYLCAEDPSGMAPLTVPGWQVVRLAERGTFKRTAGDRQLVAAGVEPHL
jgi:hypothetical protein